MFAPVIKWTGSKRSQAEEIIKHFPQKINCYYEPFLGGGSMMRAVMESDIQVGEYRLSDINSDLITLWNVIRTSPEQLATSYERLWHALNDPDDDKARKIDYYNGVRSRFNRERDPADFLFLLRTCANGMPRYNSRGEFNTSFHITRDGIRPDTLRDIIMEWSTLLNRHNVTFTAASYETVRSQSDDFLYLDPPYAGTKGIYYGSLDNDRFFRWLAEQQGGFALSFDGRCNERDYTYAVPSELYQEHAYIRSGNSSFRRVTGKSRDSIVYESLYVRHSLSPNIEQEKHTVMNEQKNLGKIEPWEMNLAEIMCGSNLQQQLHRVIGIIREVQVDSDGERILTPPEWLEQTRRMSEAERDEFIRPKRVVIVDVRNRYSFQVPASLKDNFVKLFDIGLRHPVAITSGRLADDPNRRDNKGYPYALSALARPLARVIFDIQNVQGGMESLTPGQKNDIREAAKEAGWCIDNTGGKYLTLLLPSTQSGLTADEVAKLAKDKLNLQSPGWREQSDWHHQYIDAVKNEIQRQGGHIMYTDRDIADAWNRLTQAIVQKTRQRWERENPRITDIQINRQVDTVKQTVKHTIRCRIDGAQQMSVPMHVLDGGRYDRALHLADQTALAELKRELAGTYFSRELQMDRNEVRGMIR